MVDFLNGQNGRHARSHVMVEHEAEIEHAVIHFQITAEFNVMATIRNLSSAILAFVQVGVPYYVQSWAWFLPLQELFQFPYSHRRRGGGIPNWATK